MNKLKNALVFGAGYVLGARAGRARYEQLKHSATRIAKHPRTQALVHEASGLARDRAVAARERIGTRLPARFGGTRPATTSLSAAGPLPDADPLLDADPLAVPDPMPGEVPSVIDLSDGQFRSGSLPGTA